MTDPIQRLLTEFAAQDCSTKMVALVDGKHVVVAEFSEGSHKWEPTAEGLALLNPPDETEPPVETQRATNLKMSLPKK